MLLARVDFVHVYDGQGIEESRRSLFEVYAMDLSVPGSLGLVPFELHAASICIVYIYRQE